MDAGRAVQAGGRGVVLAAVAVGGGLGGLARLGVGTVLAAEPGGFPWGTFLANVTGAFALGTLMVVAAGLWPASRLLRPFLGVGLLGGYTTFSAYVLDTQDLVLEGRTLLAAAYLFGTLAVGVLAVGAGMATGRAVVRRSGGPAGTGTVAR